MLNLRFSLVGGKFRRRSDVICPDLDEAPKVFAWHGHGEPAGSGDPARFLLHDRDKYLIIDNILRNDGLVGNTIVCE